MTTNQRIRAHALQAAVHTIALFPKKYLDEIQKQNQSAKPHADVYVAAVTAIAHKYADYISEGSV
ncbi:MAG: hypothetical protein LBP20_04660 [Treponema sp.]|jgi:hypothetical protein|nr:hypothetical protein [Treponema sp.]